MGAITAAISPKAAMACTAAVETEIDKHYQAQLDELGDSDPELSEAIADFEPRNWSIATMRWARARRRRSPIRCYTA